MTDHVVLIPVPGLGTLALELEQYRAALAAGAELTGAAPPSSTPTDEQLLDAEQAASQLRVTARWLEDGARAGIVPHVKLGRFIRFSVREVAEHFRVSGAAPPTDSQSVTPFRRHAKQ